MKPDYKREFTIFGLIISISMLFGFVRYQQDKWEVPTEYQTMVNPVKTDANSLDIGKEIYNMHCKACHGKTGLGDGSKAAGLKKTVPKIVGADFNAQTEGVILYKSFIGRDDYHSKKGKIVSDKEDQWSVVNYVKSFK